MNRIRTALFSLIILALFSEMSYASRSGDREIVVFTECRGDQNVFDVKSLVEKNRAYFEQRGIKVTFSRAKGCGYLLVNKRDMAKLDASLEEKELLDRCEKFFFPDN